MKKEINLTAVVESPGSLVIWAFVADEKGTLHKYGRFYQEGALDKSYGEAFWEDMKYSLTKSTRG